MMVMQTMPINLLCCFQFEYIIRKGKQFTKFFLLDNFQREVAGRRGKYEIELLGWIGMGFLRYLDYLVLLVEKMFVIFEIVHFEDHAG